MPTWAIPYSSLWHYFNDHHYTAMEYKMMGGWNNTAPFGHELNLFHALYGGF